MHRRAVRFGVVVLLLIGGAGASLVIRGLHRQLKTLTSDSQQVAGRLAAMKAVVADLAEAQGALITPGPPPRTAAARVSALAQALNGDADAIRGTVRSVQAATLLQALADRTATLASVDQRLRDASDEDGVPVPATVVPEIRGTVDAMRAMLSQLVAAEASAAAEKRAALQQQIWTVTGTLAIAWVLGILALARVPRAAALETSASVLPSPTGRTFDLTPAPRDDAETSAPAIDLAAAADLCTELARVTSAAALPDMLARAAAVLDASGLVLWIGAGEELLAASAYGYDPAVISRLGPIPRAAENATAAAWRTGEVRTVSGDMMSNGAVVAPLLGPDHCIGVLAAEIRHGREGNVGTRAVTAMIAAQLATVVAAWPAAGGHDSGR